MSNNHKVWSFYEEKPDIEMDLVNQLHISPIIAKLLINRGITNVVEVKKFLCGGLELLHDPALLKDGVKAAERVLTAVTNDEKITIFGDYDVDGITASSILYMFLQKISADVHYYIPDRQSEGYGLNLAALAKLHENGTCLLITVDCGISAIAEVAAMKGIMDVIITDHHQPPDVLPNAYAIVNPKQIDCGYPDKNLAGVGVAYKVCQAIWNLYAPSKGILLDFMDIVAIGTIADIVPIVGENRILVRMGLAALQSTKNIGLQALLAVSGLTNIAIDTGKVGFALAPRLNAVGRISHAKTGVKLLTTTCPKFARSCAELCNNENIRRQELEKEIIVLADAQVQAMAELPAVIVIAGVDWNPGVIGIVASRIVEKYYRPTIIISVQDGVGKGSCRSVVGFNIYEALKECSALLEKFGGHQQAAGITISIDNLELFQQKINEYALQNVTEDCFIPHILIDSTLLLNTVNPVLLEELAQLAPFGMGNPTPVFACDNLEVVYVNKIGHDCKHIKMRIKQKEACCDVVGWNMGEFAVALKAKDEVSIAFRPEFNIWQGRRNIQLIARDIRIDGVSNEFFQRIRIKDCRNVEKLYYIRQLIADGKKVAIYSFQRGNYEYLAQALEDELSHSIGNVVNRVIGDYPIDDGNYQHIIIYDLALDWTCWADCIRYHLHFSEVLDIYLIFDYIDLQNSIVNIKENAVSRNIIGVVYLTLQKLINANSLIDLYERQVIEVLEKYYSVVINSQQLADTANILAELGLIEFSSNGFIRMLIKPEQKLDLFDSRLYQIKYDVQQDVDKIYHLFNGTVNTEKFIYYIRDKIKQYWEEKK